MSKQITSSSKSPSIRKQSKALSLSPMTPGGRARAHSSLNIEFVLKQYSKEKTQKNEILLLIAKESNKIERGMISGQLLQDIFLRAFSKLQENRQTMTNLIHELNTKCDPNELFRLYQQVAQKDQENADLLYQHFTTFAPPNAGYPATLSTFDDLEDTRSDIELAFACFTDWNASYFGITKLWELMKEDPSIKFDQYFEDLSLPRQIYIITGLQQLAEEEGLLDQYEEAFENLQSISNSESSTTKTQRSAAELLNTLSDISGSPIVQTPRKTPKH